MPIGYHESVAASREKCRGQKGQHRASWVKSSRFCDKLFADMLRPPSLTQSPTPYRAAPEGRGACLRARPWSTARLGFGAALFVLAFACASAAQARRIRSNCFSRQTRLNNTAKLTAGDSKSAATTTHQALDRDPQLPGGWSLYRRALMKAGDNEGAKVAFERALLT